ncbi:MAG TPA: hypothetical protein VFE14_10270 [Micromonosporaceae bacterium]|nr:hypothetical protein [Micromonosporaceae bacterium]
MPDDVYIEVTTAVREQLRGLEPDERNTVVDALYSALGADGRPIWLPGAKGRLYACTVEGYAFFYRELTRKELAHAGADFGYLVVAMKAIPQWLRGKLGG